MATTLLQTCSLPPKLQLALAAVSDAEQRCLACADIQLACRTPFVAMFTSLQGRMSSAGCMTNANRACAFFLTYLPVEPGCTTAISGSRDLQAL